MNSGKNIPAKTNPTKYIPKVIFGMPVELADDDISSRIPKAMLKEAAIVRVHLDAPADADFYVVAVSARLAMKPLRALVEAVVSEGGLPCAVCCPGLDVGQMVAFAREGIPYIRDANNMYLPFIGAAMSTVREIAAPRPLSPQAQRIFLNYLAGGWVNCSAGEIAEWVGKSAASVTKYLAELTAVWPGIVTVEGKRRMLRPPSIANDTLLSMFEPYLTDPVHKVHRFISPFPIDDLREVGAKMSGESALARFSDLAYDPEKLEVALDSKGFNRLREKLGGEVVEAAWFEEAAIVVEEWACPIDLWLDLFVGPYNLALLHPTALYASLLPRIDESDERLMDAMMQLRESICRK